MKVAKEFPTQSEWRSKGRKYKWDEMTDGKPYELEAGKDFTCKPESLQTAAAGWAKNNGWVMRTAMTPERNVIVQFMGRRES